MYDEVERVLQEVRYIPGLKRNLISLGTLDMKGFSYKASGGILKVFNGCHYKKIRPLPTHICVGKIYLCVGKSLLLHIQKVKRCIGKCL